MHATWIASNAAGVPRDTKLGDAELRAGGAQSQGQFTLTPPNGWATGEYRIELSLDGSPARTERFRVEPAAGSPAASPSVPGTASPTTR